MLGAGVWKAAGCAVTRFGLYYEHSTVEKALLCAFCILTFYLPMSPHLAAGGLEISPVFSKLRVVLQVPLKP